MAEPDTTPLPHAEWSPRTDAEDAVATALYANKHRFMCVREHGELDSPNVCRVFSENAYLSELPRTFDTGRVMLSIVRPALGFHWDTEVARSRYYPYMYAVEIEPGCLTPREYERIEKLCVYDQPFWDVKEARANVDESRLKPSAFEMPENNADPTKVRPLNLWHRILESCNFKKRLLEAAVFTAVVPGAKHLTVWAQPEPNGERPKEARWPKRAREEGGEITE